MEKNYTSILKKIKWVPIGYGILILMCSFIIIISIILYFHNNTPSKNNPNTQLTNINYGVQIGYNLIYLCVAITVLLVAINQLFKTREATNIQSLHTVLNRYNSNEMMNKRIELANYILAPKGAFAEKIEFYKDRINKWVNLEDVDLEKEDKISIATLKNKIEAVIYEFEVLGYFKKRGIYKLEDIYQLFSYEVQRYWLLINELGFIEFLRNNKAYGEDGYYDNFQKLYETTIRYEICEYECSIDLSDEEAQKIIKKKKESLEMFIYEESLLLNNGN